MRNRLTEPLRLCALALGCVALHNNAYAAPPEYLLNLPGDDHVELHRLSPIGCLCDRLPHQAASNATPDEFLSGMEWRIQPRFYYFHQTIGDQVREDSALGGRISLTTGWWRDLARFHFTGFTSQETIWNGSGTGTGILAPDDDSYAVLGEAWAEFRFNGHLAGSLGRRGLKLPFFNVHDSRMTPKTHEIAELIYQDERGNRLSAGHISRMKQWNESTFEPLSDFVTADDVDNRGATFLGYLHQFSDDLQVGFFDAYVHDVFNTFYTEADLHREWHNTEFGLSAQLALQDEVGSALAGPVDARFAGLKATATRSPFTITLAATSNSGGSALRSPWGGSPAYNFVMLNGFARAGEESWRTGLAYDFAELGIPGLTWSANYMEGDTPDTGALASADQRELNTTLGYRFQNEALDGLEFKVRAGRNDGGHLGLRREELRVIFNYTKTF